MSSTFECHQMYEIFFIFFDTQLYLNIPLPWDSILDAMLTVSPNKQYLGIFVPTTPARTGPALRQFKSKD